MTESTNPFPGLRSFEPDEDHLFFGREKQVDELLERLNRRRFLAIVGTSGSGKSSLIRSGLVPSLYSGYMLGAGSSWRVAIFRPGEDPLGNLANALANPDILGPDDDDLETVDINRELLEATLLSGDLGLVEVVRQARIPAEDNLLVIVDQFEELFRFKASRTSRQAEEDALAFVKLLLASARQEDLPIYTAITMRSDFIGDCTHFPGLAEAINDGQYLVPRMVRDERRQAVLGPVAVGGGEISPRLVSGLLNEVGDNPDQLPIMQHALMRTWADWEENSVEGEPLDLHHYEAIGTMRGALSQHAEEAFQELDERNREIAEKVFKALTDKGTDARGIRSPRSLAELCELANAEADEVRTVIECFRCPGRSFLMPPQPMPLETTSIIDISHESLMRNWERLIQWSNEEAQSAQVYLRLAEAAKRFQESESGGLWSDPELESALNWRQQVAPTAIWARRYDPAFERAMAFLDESQKERDRRLREREERRQRQLAFAKRLSLGAAAAALAFALLGLYAMDQRNKARVQSQEAEGAKILATEQAKAARTAADEAEKQEAAAKRAQASAEAAQQKANGLRETAVAEKKRAEKERQNALREKANAEKEKVKAEEAQLAAQHSAEQAQKNFEEAKRQEEEAKKQGEEARSQRDKADRLSLLAGSRALAEQCMALSKDQTELAALLAVEAYRLHTEAHSNDDHHEAPQRQPHVYRALVQTWQNLDGASSLTTQYQGAIRALALVGGRDRWIVGGGEGGRVEVHDPQRPETPGSVLQESGTAIRSLAIDPSPPDAVGHLIAAGDLQGGIHLWRLEAAEHDISKTEITEAHAAPKAHAGAVYSLAFAGENLVSGGGDGEVRLWRASDLGTAQLLWQGDQPIRALAVASDGHTLVVGHGRDNDGGALRLWDLRRPEENPRTLRFGNLETNDVPWALTFDPSSQRLAVGTRRGQVWIWGALDRPPRQLTPHRSQVDAITWSAPDLLATASYDGNVRLWSLEQARGEVEPVDLPHGTWVHSVALTAEGDRVISASKESKESKESKIYVRPTRMAELAESICRRSGRDLTPEEQSDYLPEDLDYRPTCPR